MSNQNLKSIQDKIKLMQEEADKKFAFTLTKNMQVVAKFFKENTANLKGRKIMISGDQQSRKYCSRLMSGLERKLDEAILDALLDGTATIQNPDKIVEVATGKVLKVLSDNMEWVAPASDIVVATPVVSLSLKSLEAAAKASAAKAAAKIEKDSSRPHSHEALVARLKESLKKK